MFVGGLVEISADDDVVMKGLVGLNGFNEVSDERLPWVEVGSVLLVKGQSLLVPCGIAYSVCGIFVDLVSCDNRDGLLVFAS